MSSSLSQTQSSWREWKRVKEKKMEILKCMLFLSTPDEKKKKKLRTEEKQKLYT